MIISAKKVIFFLAIPKKSSTFAADFVKNSGIHIIAALMCWLLVFIGRPASLAASTRCPQYTFRSTSSFHTTGSYEASKGSTLDPSSARARSTYKGADARTRNGSAHVMPFVKQHAHLIHQESQQRLRNIGSVFWSTSGEGNITHSAPSTPVENTSTPTIPGPKKAGEVIWDGKLYDEDGNYIGYVDAGIVYDKNGNPIGYWVNGTFISQGEPVDNPVGEPLCLFLFAGAYALVQYRKLLRNE